MSKNVSAAPPGTSRIAAKTTAPRSGDRNGRATVRTARASRPRSTASASLRMSASARASAGLLVSVSGMGFHSEAPEEGREENGRDGQMCCEPGDTRSGQSVLRNQDQKQADEQDGAAGLQHRDPEGRTVVPLENAPQVHQRLRDRGQGHESQRRGGVLDVLLAERLQ